MNEIKNLIITSGDPGGIGTEVIIKALHKFEVPDGWKVLILGDIRHYSVLCDQMSLKNKWDCIIKKGKLPEALPGKILFIDFANVSKIMLGKTGKEYGRATVEYLEYALAMHAKGMMNALVTAPICKKSMWLAGYHYAGHTHYLARKTKIKYLTMSMHSNALKVFFVTDHIPFSKIIQLLSLPRIIKTVERAQDCIKRYYAEDAKIGMCSLNPHGGEEGIFGHEEKMITAAGDYWRNKGLHISSPMAPEICFRKAVSGEFDGIIAQYHDQGMIPFKLTSQGKGLNVSLGLPFTRVSPEHGTAFDIADKFIADESSMLNALYYAVRA